MLAVLFNWAYLAFTTFCVGFGSALLVQKKLRYKVRGAANLMAMGLVAATVYAQTFSLVYKVGALANVIWFGLCIALAAVYRREMLAFLRSKWDGCGICRRVVPVVLVLVWAYFTSRGFMHYDSDLYHAQSIRWIEEYGIVAGLGNLHLRFAYNSSLFALSALYSMQWLLGESLHTVCGFCALLLSVSVMGVMDSWRTRRFGLTDFARVAAGYYLTMICDEVVSPASDYAVMCAVFYIVIEWLALLERKEANSAPYALLCVGGVFTMTLKLTAALLLLIVVKPLVMLIRGREWRKIVLYLGLGLVTALPWLARNVILSGYLIYPFPALDLFDVDWKIAAGTAAADAAEIKVYGRALYDVTRLDTGIARWLPNWFNTTLDTTQKLLIVTDAISLGVTLVLCMIALYRKKREWYDTMLLILAVAVSYVFWQFSAPLIRYGYAYVLLLAVLPVGFIWIRCKRWLQRAVYYAVLAAAAFKLIPLTNYAVGVGAQPYYVSQQPYGTYETVSCEIDGVTFYYPVSGDRVGYDAFPSSDREPDVELRGEGIEDGFR